MARQRQSKVGARTWLGAVPRLDLSTAETETLRWLRAIGTWLPVNREWDGSWHAACGTAHLACRSRLTRDRHGIMMEGILP
jgi:hypothetical protein